MRLPPKPPSNEKSEITASSPSNIFAVWILTLRINANTPTYIKSRIWYHNFYSFQHFSKFKYWLWGLTPIPQPPSNLKSETTTPFNTFCSSNFDLRHTSYLSRTPRTLSVENFWSCGEISDIKKFEMWRNLRCGEIYCEMCRYIRCREILDVEQCQIWIFQI